MLITDPPGQRGFVHEALIYDSDRHFLDVVVPFLRAGLTAGEPTLLGVNAHQTRLVLDALGGGSGLTVLAGAERYARPLSALWLNWQLFNRHVDAGAARIRMVGEVPRCDTAADWDGWVRYEAAINHVYAALPVWGICPYPRRGLPAAVRADIEHTHARLSTTGATHRRNPRYVEPHLLLADRARSGVEPFERRVPDLDVTGPTLDDVRLAVATLALGTALDDEAVSGLVFATNEVLTNALVHGRRPVRVRAWVTADRLTVAVRDGGDGPADPYAGLLPRGTAAGPEGGGLWLAGRMCDGLTWTRSADGFTVYLAARAVRPGCDAAPGGDRYV